MFDYMVIRSLCIVECVDTLKMTHLSLSSFCCWQTLIRFVRSHLSRLTLPVLCNIITWVNNKLCCLPVGLPLNNYCLLQLWQHCTQCKTVRAQVTAIRLTHETMCKVSGARLKDVRSWKWSLINKPVLMCWNLTFISATSLQTQTGGHYWVDPRSSEVKVEVGGTAGVLRTEISWMKYN